MDFRNRQIIHSIVIGLVVSISMIATLFSSIGSYEKSEVQTERIVVLEKFLRFQSDAETVINESINLLEGYLTYIETNPEISEDDSIEYLDSLLDEKITLIRNIGIIKDTTITWNYPKEGNEKAIGVDITTVPNQRENALRVKKTLESVFIGPVNLIQGGTGFISRIPIVVDEKYWGQISLVLDGEKYLEYVRKDSENHGLNVAIYNEEFFPSKAFYGDEDIIDRDGIVLDVKILGEKWKVAVEPVEGWNNNKEEIAVYRMLAFVFSLIVGAIIFSMFNTRHKLRELANHDNLTGLNNRNYLDHHYYTVRKKVDDFDGKLGIFLLDINSFKKINDNYGHKVGDLVLTELSSSLENININQKKVFRLGGDEFLIIFSGVVDEKDLKYIDRLVRASSSFRYNHEKVDIEVNSSVGYAIYPNDGIELDEVMHVADSRMYVEKRNK